MPRTPKGKLKNTAKYRVRGKHGVGKDGKFYFQLQKWNLKGTKQVGEPAGPYGPYETLEICLNEMAEAALNAAKASGDMGTHDMKTGKYNPILKVVK